MTLESYFAPSESWKYSNSELCNYIFTYYMHIHARLYALYAVYVTVTCILNTHIFTYTRTDTCIYTHTHPYLSSSSLWGQLKKKKQTWKSIYSKAKHCKFRIKVTTYGLTHRYTPADKRIQRWINSGFAE